LFRTSLCLLTSIDVILLWMLSVGLSSVGIIWIPFVLLPKKGQKLWLTCHTELIVVKKIRALVFVAFVAHDTPILWSWRGIWKVCVGLILLQYLLMYPFTWNQASSPKNVSFGSRTLVYCLKKPDTKLCSCNHLLQLLEPVLFYAAINLIILCTVFIVEKRPSRTLFHQFENHWWRWNAATRTLRAKSYSWSIYRISFSHSYLIRKIHCSSVCFTICVCCCKWEQETDFWVILVEQKHNEKWAAWAVLAMRNEAAT
jgi:hypothetical protein